MPQTFTIADAVELAVVERSGFVESRHAGSAVVLGPDGDVRTALGDIDTPILPRSTLKPFQALACLTAGVELDGAQLGLATASHTGTDRHADVVRDILRKAELGEDDLGCPPAWPGDTATRDEIVRELGAPARIRMNCSGKHATMLLACRVNGWDVATYLDPQHPLQAHIREVMERMTGARAHAMAIDGCGAPVYGMPLVSLARGIQRVATASERSPFAMHRSAAQLVAAVKQHPWTIEGPSRPDTELIDRLGVFAKTGAEGVLVMAAPDGTTVALKMLDGSARAAHVVALTLLVRSGALAAAAVAQALGALPLTVHGGGRDVGAIRPTV